MESRIKQLREKRGLIQEILAVELGVVDLINYQNTDLLACL